MLKRFGQISVLLITYISISIVLIVLLIGSLFLIDHLRYEAQYSNQKIEREFHQNEASFQSVVVFIQNVNMSPYQTEDTDKPYITIREPESLPKDSIYKYSVISASVDSIAISNNEINATLDDLFRNTDLTSIWQTNAAESPSIFFKFSALAGLVFSPTGNTPVDSFDASMVYTYERVNDSWFYWTGVWPD